MVSMRSWGLVGGQVLLLGYLALSGSWWVWQGSAVFLVAGALLGLWALASMRLRHLRIVPEVHPEGRLVAHGPYRWIRHPMYTSVLLVSAGMVLADPQPLRIAAGLGLAAVLVLKLLHEEKLLHRAFPEYAAYCATTQRLVPWVW